ncbi:matrixin family metalloprotease [Lactiplantibacillus pentosus]|uniref:matrixin family metalloprotease n=1 Tax=Lactiplantibacillus pentosus TaxID=1589 RepID=UPI0013302311|nr:matrixin family metalloprotease [Lactiplantibacillus pentosus]MBQ0835851.1 matrixin family metalloprotease [Lactiplantibacillus pentosus]
MKHWRVLVVIGALVIGGWGLNQVNFVRSQQAALQRPQSVRKLPATVINELQRMIQPLRSLVETPKTASNVTISRGTTPVNSLVARQQLSSKYVYHFEQATPKPVKRVFHTAIQTYNQTGLVQLRPGKPRLTRNSLTLGTYQRQQSHANGSIELGQGGPTVTYAVVKTLNHGQARLNTAYPEAIATSVAIHEVGHALGLDHSRQLDSVMYPFDQGQTTLSHADISALKTIYG